MVRTGGGLAPSMGSLRPLMTAGPPSITRTARSASGSPGPRIKPTLTNETIQAATRHAQGLLEQQAAKGAEPKAPEPLQVLENHRAAPRHRVLKAGSIEFNGGVIDCTIRNVSDTGAALEVASPVGVPDSFWLVVRAIIRAATAGWPGERTSG